MMVKQSLLAVCLLSSMVFMAGNVAQAESTGTLIGSTEQDDDGQVRITEAEMIAAQRAWGDGIVNIGRLYQSHGNYQAAAGQLLDRLYAFNQGQVLFKPTKASEDQFRETRAEALSYFVRGIRAEDHGFALQPWSRVRFENKVISLNKDTAESMGNYYFTDVATGVETKVEYTFGYRRDRADGHLRIFLHHSSLPYNPHH